MSQKGFAPIIVVLVIFIGAATFFLLRNNHSSQPPNQTQQGQEQISIDTNSPKQILTALQNKLSVTSPISNRNTDWLDQNKEIVPLTGQGFGVGTYANAYMGKYGNYIQYPDPVFLKDITEDSFKPLQLVVDKFFITNGFQKDNNNTFRNEGWVYLSMGYTKGDINCLTTLTPQTDPFGNFFCGTVDQTQIAWRKELVPIINPKNIPNFSVEVRKLSGNYAYGGAGVPPGGYVWYAVKIDGKWKKVWTGQNTISCKPVNQYNIPKEIYGNDCSPNY